MRDDADVRRGPGAQAAAPTGIRFDERGLVPVIVQDRATRDILMLGYTDEEALRETLRTGLAHFHSRSRNRLWCKGETSGNVLTVREIRVDCDGDALLLAVDPAGPTCHSGARTCFDRVDRPVEPTDRSARARTVAPTESPPLPPQLQGFGWLEVLWTTIRLRAEERPDGSYTASLLDGGVDTVARKVVEEATEVLMAAKDDAHESSGRTRARLVEEVADLLYHVLVLAAERDLPPSSVLEILRVRHAGERTGEVVP